MNGNLIIVKLNGRAIAGTTSNDITVKCGTEEVASPTQGRFREYIAGRSDWTVKASYLVRTASVIDQGGFNIRDMLKVGNTYTLTFGERFVPTDGVEGQAILTECRITATKGNLVQGSFSFKGTGTLT